MDLQSIKNRFGIIGNSPALNYALQVAAQVANTDLTVLIAGLVHAPCGSARGPAATKKGLPAYVTRLRGASVQSSAKIVATAGEKPISRNNPATR